MIREPRKIRLWRSIYTIWMKEIRDNVRDRKALRQSITTPLIFGLIFALFTPLVNLVLQWQAERQAQQMLIVPAEGVAYASPELLSTLGTFHIELMAYDTGVSEAVESGEVEVALLLSEGFADSVAEGQSAPVQLLSNPLGGFFSRSADIQRVENALDTFRVNTVIQRLTAEGVSPDLLEPLTIEREILTTPEQKAGKLATFILPLMLSFVVLTGGAFVAIDVTAGEKERGTLEALLASPASDQAIFLGKYFAVLTVTLIPLLLTFMSFGLIYNLLPEWLTDGARMSPTVILGAMASGIPFAILAAVVMMIVAIRTKTFKDAQATTAGVNLSMMFPAMIPAIFPVPLSWLYLIPIYGAAGVASELATFGHFPLMHFLLNLIGTVMVTALGVMIGLRLFNRERLLYSM